MLRLVLKVALCFSFCFATLQSFSQLIYWSEPGTGSIKYATLTAAGWERLPRDADTPFE